MKLKRYKLLFFPIALAAIIAGCKKDDPNQFLKDNVNIVGYNPVIASFTAPGTQAQTPGSTIKLDLRYWSDDPIDKINLNAKVGNGASTGVLSVPYQPAYSAVSKTDSLNLQYQIPTGTPTGTTIVLEAQVVNKNALTVSSTINLKVQ